MKMTQLLISSEGKNRLRLIVEKAAKVTGCNRVCLISKDKQGGLTILEGFPRNGHGIGQKITPEIGKDFLSWILEKSRSTVLINHPDTDPRISYMRDLVKNCGICSILFVPLFYKGEAIGILVFDSTCREKQRFTKYYQQIRFLSDLAATSIGREKERQKYEEKIIKKERLCTLGENSARIAHTVRNALLTIGGFSRRMSKVLASNGLCEDTQQKNLKTYAEIILSTVENLERTVNDVLMFSRPPKLCLVSSNINEFLVTETDRLIKSHRLNGTVVKMDLNKRLERIKVSFDKHLLSLCLDDLFRNAVEASAKNIVIKNNLKPKQGKIELLFLNDGKRIDPLVISEIFEPFTTTKSDGTGLGLANVRAIIEAHCGEISIEDNERTTEFKILLPLQL